MKLRYLINTTIAIVAAATLTACATAPKAALPNPNFAINLEGSESPTPADTPQIDQTALTPSPRIGGHLHAAVPLPATLNPLLNSDPHMAAFLRLIFEPLAILDEQMRPMPNPAITQSIVFSPSGTNVAVTLREGIFWEDGSPITAQDIAFSIDVLRNQSPQTAIYRPNVENISSHSTLDARTIQINLANPKWGMMYMLNFPIIPAEYYRPISMTNLTAARNMHPMGNGPFRFYSHELAGHIGLIPNNNAPGGAPYIQRITGLILRDMHGARYAFEQGVIDVHKDSPALAGLYAARGKNRAGDVITNYFDFIGFNFENPIFAHYDARLAVAQSIDLGQVLQQYIGQVDAALAPINPNSFISQSPFASQSSFASQSPFASQGDSTTQNGSTTQNSSTNQESHYLPQHNIAHARWVFLRLGNEYQDYREIRLIVNEDNSQGLDIAQRLLQGLTEAGVRVSLHALPFSDFAMRIEQGDFDIMVGAVLLPNMPNVDFLGDIMGYASYELDLISSMLRHAPTEAALITAAANMQQYFADNLPLIGIGFRRDVLYTSGHLHVADDVLTNGMFMGAGGWFMQ